MGARNKTYMGEQSYTRWLAFAVAFTATLAGGVLFGHYSQRWGPPHDLRSAAEHVEQMPTSIGEWKLVEELSMSPTAIQMLECAGYVNRQYVHQGTGQEIAIAVIVGPPGPTSVHTPEICFSSRAYDQQGDRSRMSLGSTGDGADSFWMVDFTTRNVLANQLRTYYAWSDGGPWQAADAPRFDFSAVPFLYKIQIAADVPPKLANQDDDAGRDFLIELIRSPWQQQLGND